jgi:hypothetical protein
MKRASHGGFIPIGRVRVNKAPGASKFLRGIRLHSDSEEEGPGGSPKRKGIRRGGNDSAWCMGKKQRMRVDEKWEIRQLTMLRTNNLDTNTCTNTCMDSSSSSSEASGAWRTPRRWELRGLATENLGLGRRATPVSE